jgi:hypothetical protein
MDQLWRSQIGVGRSNVRERGRLTSSRISSPNRILTLPDLVMSSVPIWPSGFGAAEGGTLESTASFLARGLGAAASSAPSTSIAFGEEERGVNWGNWRGNWKKES